MKEGEGDISCICVAMREFKGRSRAGCYVLLLTSVRCPLGFLHFELLSCSWMLSVSIAVAQEYVASHDTENEINL